MYNQPFWKVLSLKTLHHSGIRTQDLLLFKQARWPQCHATGVKFCDRLHWLHCFRSQVLMLAEKTQVLRQPNELGELGKCWFMSWPCYGIFYRRLGFITTIWYILSPFGTFFPCFGIMFKKNLATLLQSTKTNGNSFFSKVFRSNLKRSSKS
jgi:hypothetical protein